jgi:hypothetical protein
MESVGCTSLKACSSLLYSLQKADNRVTFAHTPRAPIALLFASQESSPNGDAHLSCLNFRQLAGLDHGCIVYIQSH